MSIKIITDSTSDIGLAEARSLGISVVLLKTVFEDGEYLDGVDLTAEEFYKKQVEAKKLPTTTQPTPADFEDVYRNALEDEDDDIIAILISEKLSGTFQSATIAKQSFDRNIYIVDSGTTTIGLRILVERAVYLRNQGLKTKEVVDILEKEKSSIRLYAYVDTLEYLQKGGRLSKGAAFAGTLLNVKPLISLADGTLHACGKARGIKKAYSQVIELANADGIDFSRPTCLGYTGDPTPFQPFKDLVCQTYNNKITLTSTIGSVVGAHAGPGAAAIAFFKK